jgi:hypothetical protein
MDGIIETYCWVIRIAAVLLFTGFAAHPPLSLEGMAHGFWVPDHVMILLSLVLMIPAYAWLSLRIDRPSALGIVGLVFTYLAMCSFLGVVYFELMVIPTIVSDAPHVLDNGLRIGPLAWALPVTGLSFVIAHFILGIAWWNSGMSRGALALLMLGSIGVGLKPVLPDMVYITGTGAFALGWIFLSNLVADTKGKARKSEQPK